MAQSVEFIKLEQRAFLAYHRDGLIDLTIGSVILLMAMSEVTNSSTWNLFALLIIFAYMPLKRRITYPRLGYARFNVKRGGVNMRTTAVVATIILVVLLTGILVLMLVGGFSESPLVLAVRQSPEPLYALFGFIGFGLAGLVLGLKRLYIYALLSPAIMTAGHLFNLPLWMPLLVLGGIILVIGAVLLTGFLLKYPVAEEENNDPR